jgi:hypothetical protein
MKQDNTMDIQNIVKKYNAMCDQIEKSLGQQLGAVEKLYAQTEEDKKAYQTGFDELREIKREAAEMGVALPFGALDAYVSNLAEGMVGTGSRLYGTMRSTIELQLTTLQVQMGENKNHPNVARLAGIVDAARARLEALPEYKR